MATPLESEIDLAGEEVLKMSGEEILEYLEIDRERYGEAKRRWQATWDFDNNLDRWPLIATFPTEKIRRSPIFPPLKDRSDTRRTLWNSINPLIRRHLVDDDSMPVIVLDGFESARIIPLAFGSHFLDAPDEEAQVAPFINDVNEVLDWSHPNMAESDALKEMSEMFSAIQELVGEKGYIHSSCASGGPFTIAQMMRGGGWFEDLYLAKPAAHRLLELVCEAYIQLWNLETEILNYPSDSEGYSREGAFIPRGIQTWECSDIMISNEMCDEFCRPYQERLFERFGGGMRQVGPEDERLLDVLLDTKGTRCICPEVLNDFDVEKVTKAAHERGIAVTWTKGVESREDHYVHTPISSVAEFKDWIEWMRKQTHHAKAGIGLIVYFSDLAVARKSLEAWERM